MKKLFETLRNLFIYYDDDKKYNFTLPETQEEKSEIDSSFEDNVSTTELPEETNHISTSLADNLTTIKIKYNTLINSDIITREFSVIVKDKEYKACLLYIDGMVDSTQINNFILKPLMLRNIANTYQGNSAETSSKTLSNNVTIRKVKKFDLLEYIYQHLIPQNSVKKVTKFTEAFSRS